MARLRVHNFAMSLDGYVAGPNQSLEHPLGVGGERLHEWVFAVGAFRQIDIAAAFVVSDLLFDKRWHAQFHDAVEPLRQLYTSTVDVLSALG